MMVLSSSTRRAEASGVALAKGISQSPVYPITPLVCHFLHGFPMSFLRKAVEL